MTDLGRIRPDIGASSGPGDLEIAEFARRQHGVVSYSQLLTLGFRRRAIQHRVEAGRLHRVQFGVYAVGHAVLSWHGRCLAAVLSYGPSAVLSHRTGVWLWELRPSSSAFIEVTVPARGCRARKGVRLHRVRDLHPDDRTVREGIPVTSLARTLLDFAEVAQEWELERAIDEAERRGLFDLKAIEETIERNPGRRGQRPLRTVLAQFTGPPPTRNDFECDFLDLCRKAGLPLPAMNVDVAGYEVDCVWPGQSLVVELDSRTFHERRLAFEADPIRDAALHVAGYRPIRVTHRRLSREPDEVVAALRDLLSPAV